MSSQDRSRFRRTGNTGTGAPETFTSSPSWWRVNRSRPRCLAKAHKPATIDARLAAISAAHRAAGHDSPTKSEVVRLERRGMRRTVGTAQRQVRLISVPDLRSMVEHLDDEDLDSPAPSRDRAMLLIGFAGALRRSELVGLDVSDVAKSSDGLTVRLRRSKTDQEDAGRLVGIPFGHNPSTCPVLAWDLWLAIADIHDGPAFRPIDRHGVIGSTRLTDQAVALIVKRHARCRPSRGIGPLASGGS